ncbi:hypothetical protein [Brachybacterium subflavum]|uniref:hypothetical protein n=1 Tax=Brachybacterium subflavum TaxID=2585206 RepID=UPI0012667AEE|nr:hypothetical protein [Brachybacterium subflavum]
MIRGMIHEIVWRLQHPLWDWYADRKLRALGYGDHDRETYLAAAADEFHVEQARHYRADAGQAVCMLAAAGVEPREARRYLRAIRGLSPWNVRAATELIVRCVAQGRATYDDYVRLVVLSPVNREIPNDVDDVRAGKVTGDDLVWRLTT